MMLYLFFQLCVFVVLYVMEISMVCFYILLPRILKHQDSVLLCHNLVPENISVHIHILMMKGNYVIILRGKITEDFYFYF